ncbi:MAG: M48 family metalloprotease [Candidatus Aenigmarchaeota archaeon]|nr:M48 family metalloprotease [Candidatus Aenigmarchaeota archaeon]
MVVLRSWLSFALGFGCLVLIWYLGYVLVASLAPSALGYFKWGAILAGAIGAVMLVFNEPIVARTMGCVRVRERSDNPKLWDAVRRATPSLAFSRARIYVCPQAGMNAFAFGWGVPLMSAVCATEGIISGLDDDELAAVMAHEMGHVINKDILVSMAMTVSVMIIALTGWLLLRLTPYSSGRRSSSDKNGSSAILIALLVGAVFYVLGRIVGFFLQMFVSRQREYAADATSARIMGSPEPLIRALEKISGRASIGSTEHGAALGFLCTADPEPDDLISTHPTMENRIASLQGLGR